MILRQDCTIQRYYKSLPLGRNRIQMSLSVIIQSLVNTSCFIGGVYNTPNLPYMKQEFSLLLSNLTHVILPIIIGTAVLKCCLFFTFKPVKWKYYNLVYFKTGQIASAKSEHTLHAKIIQNALSYYFVFLLILELVIYIFSFE